MFHPIDQSLWLTVSPCATMRFSKGSGFDKAKLSDLVFLNNLLVT